MNNLFRNCTTAGASTLLAVSLAVGYSASAQTQDNAQSEMISMLRHAISVDTSAGTGNVPKLEKYLAKKLESAGFDRSDIEIVPYEDTAAMTVRYPGKDSEKPILFDMHLDVVPANANKWDSDPFELTKNGGYLYGRGIADMKTNAITTVQTFMRLKSEGFVPDHDMVLILVGDEETSGHSLENLDIKKRYPNADFVINGDAVGNEALLDNEGDPELFKVQTSEKTYADFQLSAKSSGGHSSEPTQDTAIYELSRALLKLQDYHFPIKYNKTTRQSLEAQGKIGSNLVAKAMQEFAKDPKNSSKATAVLLADPAYVGQIGTTCVATEIKAGHAKNALPNLATANINCRIFPGTSVDSVKETLAKVINDKSIEIETRDHPKSSDPSPVRSDIMDKISSVVHARYPDLNIIPSMTSYATDNAEYRRNGIDAYDVSPIFAKENNTFAHGSNERILASQIPWVMHFWYELIPKLANDTQ